MNLQEALDKGRALMLKHGVPFEWGIALDRSVRRLGMCSFRKKMIFLGEHATAVNSEETVTNTILHEIAHALAGPREGHGVRWQMLCISIGGDGKRLGHIEQAAPHNYEVVCRDCKKVVQKAYRVPRVTPLHFHSKCRSAFLQQKNCRDAQLEVRRVDDATIKTMAML